MIETKRVMGPRLRGGDRGNVFRSQATQWRAVDGTMPNNSDRIIVIGAGPVGLCLSLALAQADVQVTLVEQLRDDNFLDQVPRAGTNHPATLEMFDRIGLY